MLQDHWLSVIIRKSLIKASKNAQDISISSNYAVNLRCIPIIFDKFILVIKNNRFSIFLNKTLKIFTVVNEHIFKMCGSYFPSFSFNKSLIATFCE